MRNDNFSPRGRKVTFLLNITENRSFGFTVAENQAKETFKNNENALWVDGQLSPLPPVHITMQEGIQSDWIIQDMEGMVDLIFTPRESIQSGLNVLITKTEYATPLGYYNGVVLDGDGKPIHLRNLWGLGEHLYLRV